MIKSIKKCSGMISRKSAVICMIAAALVLTNGAGTVNVFAADTLAKGTAAQEQSMDNDNTSIVNPFLIDSQLKTWGRFSKVQEHAGFDFKVPGYFNGSEKPDDYQLIKKSDGSNMVVIDFDKSSGDEKQINIFKGSIEDNIKEYYKLQELSYDETFPVDILVFDYQEQDVDLGGVQGKEVTMTVTQPSYMIGGKYKTEEFITSHKYLILKDGDVNYCICYAGSYEKEIVPRHDYTTIPRDETIKILKSLEDADSVTDIDYKTDAYEMDTNLLYDKDDFKNAKNYLGNDVKLPLNADNKAVLNDCNVLCTYPADDASTDEEDIKPAYSLSLSYNYGDKKLEFRQSNYDFRDLFDSIDKNGSVKINPELFPVVNPVVPEKMNIDGKEVYKYLSLCTQPGGHEWNDAIYVWQEDGTYYYLDLIGTNQFNDEIAKPFIDSKPIE